MDNIVDVFKDESYTCSLSQEPVTLAQAKAQCRVDFSDDDDYISTLITQCRAAIESYCNISIVLKTCTVTISNNCIPPYLNRYNSISRWDYAFYGIHSASQWFELPYGPVRTVTSVTMTDNNSITVLTADTDYFLRGTLFKEMRINNWGGTALVVYYAGYTDVPNDLKLAILNEIAFRYEMRGDTANRYAQQNVGICEAAQALAQKYIRQWV